MPPGAVPNLWHLGLFLIGAVAMRGAGCTYNDIVDRDIDAAVARTRSRPIPSGQVSVGQAKLFLVAQALVGLLVLLQFNRFTVLLGVASLLTIAVYPFMKRVTDWPQVGLGIAFSWGALMGWAAFFGRLDWAPVLLYLGGILWTIGYDTIYAHQDKEDDALIGVRSTALLFGARTRPLPRALLCGRDGPFHGGVRCRRRGVAGLCRPRQRRRSSSPGRWRGSTSTIPRTACAGSAPTATMAGSSSQDYRRTAMTRAL